MKQLETSININAGVEEVWKTLMNFSTYEDWNPFVKSIKGSPEKGSTIHVELSQDQDKTMKFEPVILECEENKEFRWKGKLFVEGLFDGEHYFSLRAIDPETTEFVHGEKFTGLLVRVLLSLIGKKTEAGFDAMNKALKSRVELNQVQLK